MKVEFKQEKQINPTSQDGFNIDYAPAKRAAFKLRWYLMVLFVVSPLLFAAWYFLGEKLLVKADGIITSEPIKIFAKKDGVIQKINFKQGQSVRQHDELFEIYSPETDAEVHFLEAALEELYLLHEQSLTELKSIHQKKINLYEQAKVSNKQFIKEIKETDYGKLVPLTDRIGLYLSKLKIDNDAIQSEIDFALTVDQHNLGSGAAIILEHEKALSIAKAKESLLNSPAPQDAIVNQLFVNEGEFIEKGEPLMTLSNRAQPIVLVYLKPKDLNYAQIGGKLTIKFPNGKTYPAEIKVPPKVADKVPAILSGPFATSKAAIKVQIDINEPVEDYVEGLPVEVFYHYENVAKGLFDQVF